jgi:hypothetical protein
MTATPLVRSCYSRGRKIVRSSMSILAKSMPFFNEIGQPVMELISTEKSLINAIMSSIFILDYATIYMAVTRNGDPSPTPAIDILKKM